jgi:hypothetical protein
MWGLIGEFDVVFAKIKDERREITRESDIVLHVGSTLESAFPVRQLLSTFQHLLTTSPDARKSSTRGAGS